MARVLDISTDKVSIVRTLFGVIQDFANTICIEFFHDGLVVCTGTNCNSTRSCRRGEIDLALDAKFFYRYKCGRFNLAIDLINFNRVLRHADQYGATLRLYVRNDEKNSLYMQIHVPRQSDITYKIPVLDNHGIHSEHMIRPSVVYTTHIMISSSVFRGECWQLMRYYHHNVKICCTHNLFVMGCGGQYVFGDNVSDKDVFIVEHNENINNTYDGDIVHRMTSCAKMAYVSNFVSLYMKNDEPLIIKYDFDSKLGAILFTFKNI
jgi:hypothetical protein